MHTHTHIYTQRAPAAKLASRTVKLATGEQGEPRPPLGKGKGGKKGIEAGESERETDTEMKGEEKVQRVHDGEDGDERQQHRVKAPLRVVNELKKIRGR